jgi:serine protease inhibitor
MAHGRPIEQIQSRSPEPRTERYHNVRVERNRNVRLFGLATAVIIAGCNAPLDGGGSAMGLPKTAEQLASQRQSATAQLKVGQGAAVVNGVNSFGFDLFSRLTQAEPNGNIFISPTSVAICLAMTLNGASSETADQIAKTLRLDDISLDKVNTGYRSLTEYLGSPSANVELLVANSIWASDQIRFRQDFLDRGRQVFNAEIRTMNFRDATAATNINSWVAQATNGKIDKLIDQVPDDAVMYLINAIYFRGLWKSPFDKSLTAEEDFHLADGKSKKASFMRNTGRYAYAKTDEYEAVSLPYADDRLSMMVLLPTASGMEGFANIDANSIAKVVAGLRAKQGTVILPKFRASYEIQLNKPLAAMGMPIAFEPNRADFSGMTREAKLFISRVIHKTFVEVTEQGTEAAGVTGTEVSVTSAPIDEPFVFKADRPFLYAIRDSQTGLILFAGIMNNPSF